MSAVQKIEKLVQEKSNQCLKDFRNFFAINNKGQGTTQSTKKSILSAKQQQKLTYNSLLLISDSFLQLTQFCLNHYDSFPRAEQFKKKLRENKKKIVEIKKKGRQLQTMKMMEEIIREVELVEQEKYKENQEDQISGYRVFLKEKSQQISSVQLENSSHKNDFIANLWSNLSFQERQQYEQKAQKIKKQGKKSMAKEKNEDLHQTSTNGHEKHQKFRQSNQSETISFTKKNNFLKGDTNTKKIHNIEIEDEDSSLSSLQNDILSDSLQDVQVEKQKKFASKHLQKAISKRVSKNKPKILKLLQKQRKRT